MNLSFTLDEKVFADISPEKLIEKARDRNVSSFELSADTDILSLDKYKEIVSIVSSNGLELNYHVPYFANEVYELKHFSLYEDKLKEKYLTFLNLLENFQCSLNNNPIIVVHGCDYIEGEKSKAMDDNLKFLDWMLNIVSKRNLPFTIALETLRKGDIRNTLDSRDDVFNILNSFKSDNLKICWDMCHDKLNFHPDKTPISEDFLKHVVYCHVHGHNLKEDISHVSLVKSDIEYSKEINELLKYDFSGCINIEILSNFTKSTYLDDLFKDIDYMNKYI